MKRNFVDIYHVDHEDAFEKHNKITQNYSFSQQVIIEHGDEKLNSIGLPVLSINDLPVQNSELNAGIQVSLVKQPQLKLDEVDQQEPLISSDQKFMKELYHQYLIVKLKQEEYKKNESQKIKFRKRQIDSFDFNDISNREENGQKCCQMF